MAHLHLSATDYKCISLVRFTRNCSISITVVIERRNNVAIRQVSTVEAGPSANKYRRAVTAAAAPAAGAAAAAAWETAWTVGVSRPPTPPAPLPIYCIVYIYVYVVLYNYSPVSLSQSTDCSQTFGDVQTPRYAHTGRKTQRQIGSQRKVVLQLLVLLVSIGLWLNACTCVSVCVCDRTA